MGNRRVALIVPVGVSKLVFFGNWIAMLFLGLMCSSVIVYTGKKRRWKGRNILIGAFGLTFICVMVYSFFVRVPEAYATRPDAKLQQEKVYYMYEDHIGRPIFMNEYKNYDAGAGGDYNMVYRRDDSNGDCVYDTLEDIWRTNYTPFGVDDYSFGSVGIDVGSDSYCSFKLDDWMPPFRFPGQYADPELGDDFVYNHWRFYMPEIGRYTSPDPLMSFMRKNANTFSYSSSNPISIYDINGLFPEQLIQKARAFCGKCGVEEMLPDSEVDFDPSDLFYEINVGSPFLLYDPFCDSKRSLWQKVTRNFPAHEYSSLYVKCRKRFGPNKCHFYEYDCSGNATTFFDNTLLNYFIEVPLNINLGCIPVKNEPL